MHSGSILYPAAKTISAALTRKGRATGARPLDAIQLLLDADLLAVTAHALKAHAAIHQSKQGIVAADAHVLAGMDMGAALTHQDVAGQNELTIGALDAQTLRLGVAAVFGRTYAFFMCRV